MSDLAPDITDTLYVWNCLAQAKEGINPYGRTVAEVYVEHLIPRLEETTENTWREASRNLHKVISNFCDVNCVQASVNGREIGDWMDDYELKHKCDVRIYKGKQKRKKRSKNV